MDELILLIGGWSGRAKLQSSLYWLFFGLASGLGVALVLAIVARIFPLVSTSTLIAVSITCAITGTLAAFLWPWLRYLRTTSKAWARRFDQQFRLKERLSTALELREGVVVTNNESMRQRQQADASQSAGGLDVKKLLPLRISQRFALYAFVIALALAATITLPNPQQEVLANRAQMQQVMQEQLKQLEATKQQIEQSQALSADQKVQVIQALDDAQRTLSDPNTTPEKALAAINDAQSKLDTLRDQSWPQQRDDLQRAGQSLAPDNLTNPLANSLQNGNFQQAADQMRILGQNNGQSLNSEQRQRVADQLEQMASNVQNSDQATAQQMRDAAQNLRQGQDKAAQEALNKAADSLSKAGQKEAADQQVNRTQASVEDVRRAMSDANAKAQQAAAQQSQDAQSGSQGQQDTGNQQGKQAGSGNASGDQNQAGGQGQTGKQAPDASQSGNGQASPNGVDNNHHEDVGSANSALAPLRINQSGQDVVLSQDQGVNAPNPSAKTNPGVSNRSTVPYQQVFQQYAKTADEALRNGTVPADLRDYVHDYFSSLDPNARK